MDSSSAPHDAALDDAAHAAEDPCAARAGIVGWQQYLADGGEIHRTLVEDCDACGAIAEVNVVGPVHHARLFGRCEPKTGIKPFGRLVEQIMSTEPYKSAKTVYWVVDNGSSHAGKTSIRRLHDAYANARLIHLPVHASWLNQIEICFSILQRKALTPNDFADLDALAARITAFEAHYRQVAKPFDWTFTRAKLDTLLARLADREPHLKLAA